MSQELLPQFLTKVYGLTEDQIKPILYKEGTENELNETALDSLLALDIERVSKLKPDTKTIAAEAAQKAMNEFYTQVKGTYQVVTDKTGLDLVDEILAKKVTPPAKGEITEDAVKKSKWFLDAVEENNKKVAELEGNFEAKVNEYKTQMTKAQTFQTVKDQALAIFNGLNPILPTDTIKAKTQVDNLFLRELENGAYDIRDGKIVLLDKEGNDLQDGHGVRIPFENHVKTVAERAFEFNASKERSSAGNSGDGGSGGGAGKPIEQTKEAVMLALQTATTQEDRDAALDAYNKMKVAGKI